MNIEVDSRTCVTLPAEELRSLMTIVCMESIITSPGLLIFIYSHIA